MRQDLDSYITGNYGEDQFRDVQDGDGFDLMPEPTAHEVYFILLNAPYDYDPTDDGPEVEVIRRVIGWSSPPQKS